MSDPVQIALIAATVPTLMGVLVTLVTDWRANRKRDETKKELGEIKHLSNATLSHMTEKKEEADKKLETNLLTQLAAEKQKSAELEKQVALLTPPPKKG